MRCQSAIVRTGGNTWGFDFFHAVSLYSECTHTVSALHRSPETNTIRSAENLLPTWLRTCSTDFSNLYHASSISFSCSLLSSCCACASPFCFPHVCRLALVICRKCQYVFEYVYHHTSTSGYQVYVQGLPLTRRLMFWKRTAAYRRPLGCAARSSRSGVLQPSSSTGAALATA